jgi:hypothetical protein
MNINLLFRIFLVLHLCGLAVMVGTTVVDYFTFKTFCRLANAGDNREHGLLPIMARYGELVRTGAAILIFSGMAMLVLEKGIWLETWFKIKIGLVVLLVLNGMFIGNSLGLKFRRMIVDSATTAEHMTGIKDNLNLFYLAQLAIFLLIIMVSVIRPDRFSLK